MSKNQTSEVVMQTVSAHLLVAYRTHTCICSISHMACYDRHGTLSIIIDKKSLTNSNIDLPTETFEGVRGINWVVLSKRHENTCI